MTYEEIKLLALELLSQEGFGRTTIKNIAEKSGLKPSSIYSHINMFWRGFWKSIKK